jgi:DnaK suppressor protein
MTDDEMRAPPAREEGPPDRGSETVAPEVERSLLDQVRSELDDVEVALRRLEDDSYGTCEACGGHVGHELLAESPAARYCLHHQQVAEGTNAPRPGA